MMKCCLVKTNIWIPTWKVFWERNKFSMLTFGWLRTTERFCFWNDVFSAVPVNTVYVPTAPAAPQLLPMAPAAPFFPVELSTDFNFIQVRIAFQFARNAIRWTPTVVEGRPLFGSLIGRCFRWRAGFADRLPGADSGTDARRAGRLVGIDGLGRRHGPHGTSWSPPRPPGRLLLPTW